MNNFDKQLNELKEAIHSSSMDAQGLEQRLRSEWRVQETTQLQAMTNHKKTWKERLTVSLPLGLSGATLAILAAVTAVSISPDLSSQQAASTTSQSISTSVTDLAKGFGEKAGRVVNEEELPAGYVLPISPPDDGFENYPSPDPKKDNDLSYGDENQQLFDESVALGIRTQADIIAMIDELRTEITNLDGYVVSIQYLDATGATVALKLPSEKLTAFESYLREQDIDNTLDVSKYYVENVSVEVVEIDEVIGNAQERLADFQAELEAGQADAARREYLEQQIERQNKYIEDKQEERAEVIAQYGLVDVELSITEWGSVWEGRYWQYDKSTLGGSIKYNLAKVVYRVIRSGGGLIRFLIWLVIYSVLATPLLMVGKRVYRKVRLKHPKKTPDQKTPQPPAPPTQ